MYVWMYVWCVCVSVCVCVRACVRVYGALRRQAVGRWVVGGQSAGPQGRAECLDGWLRGWLKREIWGREREKERARKRERERESARE